MIQDDATDESLEFVLLYLLKKSGIAIFNFLNPSKLAILSLYLFYVDCRRT